MSLQELYFNASKSPAKDQIADGKCYAWQRALEEQRRSKAMPEQERSQEKKYVWQKDISASLMQKHADSVLNQSYKVNKTFYKRKCKITSFASWKSWHSKAQLIVVTSKQQRYKYRLLMPTLQKQKDKKATLEILPRQQQKVAKNKSI